MDTEGASFRDNVHASIMPRRPIIKRRHVFFVLEARRREARGRSPERFRSAKREDQRPRGAAGAPSLLPRPAISRVRPQGGPGPFP